MNPTCNDFVRKGSPLTQRREFKCQSETTSAAGSGWWVLFTNGVLLASLTTVISFCLGCASPEKRARQDADYRAEFERLCSVWMTEAGARHVDQPRQQFLPGARVTLYVTYLSRGEKLGFEVVDERGTNVTAPSEMLLTTPPGTRKKLPAPIEPQLAYPVGLVHTANGGLRTEVPVQYNARSLPGQPPVLNPGGFAQCVATFDCPTAPGRYLVAVGPVTPSKLERLKTHEFSVVSTLQPEKDAGKDHF